MDTHIDVNTNEKGNKEKTFLLDTLNMMGGVLT